MRLYAILNIFYYFFKGARIQRKSLFEFWRSKPLKGKLDQVLTFITSRFVDLNLSEDQEKPFKAYLKK